MTLPISATANTHAGTESDPWPAVSGSNSMGMRGAARNCVGHNDVGGSGRVSDGFETGTRVVPSAGAGPDGGDTAETTPKRSNTAGRSLPTACNFVTKVTTTAASTTLEGGNRRTEARANMTTTSPVIGDVGDSNTVQSTVEKEAFGKGASGRSSLAASSKFLTCVNAETNPSGDTRADASASIDTRRAAVDALPSTHPNTRSAVVRNRGNVTTSKRRCVSVTTESDPEPSLLALVPARLTEAASKSARKAGTARAARANAVKLTAISASFAVSSAVVAGGGVAGLIGVLVVGEGVGGGCGGDVGCGVGGAAESGGVGVGVGGDGVADVGVGGVGVGGALDGVLLPVWLPDELFHQLPVALVGVVGGGGGFASSNMHQSASWTHSARGFTTSES